MLQPCASATAIANFERLSNQRPATPPAAQFFRSHVCEMQRANVTAHIVDRDGGRNAAAKTHGNVHFSG
jgi:hypothetical protein